MVMVMVMGMVSRSCALESRVEGGVFSMTNFCVPKVRGSGPVDLFPDRECRTHTGKGLRAPGQDLLFRPLGLLTTASQVLADSAISKSTNREISSSDPHSPTVYGLRSSHGWLQRLNIEGSQLTSSLSSPSPKQGGVHLSPCRAVASSPRG